MSTVVTVKFRSPSITCASRRRRRRRRRADGETAGTAHRRLRGGLFRRPAWHLPERTRGSTRRLEVGRLSATAAGDWRTLFRDPLLTRIRLLTQRSLEYPLVSIDSTARATVARKSELAIGSIALDDARAIAVDRGRPDQYRVRYGRVVIRRSRRTRLLSSSPAGRRVRPSRRRIRTTFPLVFVFVDVDGFYVLIVRALVLLFGFIVATKTHTRTTRSTAKGVAVRATVPAGRPIARLPASRFGTPSAIRVSSHRDRPPKHRCVL